MPGNQAVKRALAFGLPVLFLVAAAVVFLLNPGWRKEVILKMLGKRTVLEVINRIGPEARSRYRPHFENAGAAYPPRKILLLAFKEERLLEVWAENGGHPVFICEYPIVGASGGPGPKLREGDLQVPEGRYRVSGMNPNSAFYLSLKLDYPNAFDKQQAEADGRTNLGGDIFIHGGSASIGCLAMGDRAIEELFVLSADVGLENIEVLLAPSDLRQGQAFPRNTGPAWANALYGELATALEPFRRGGQEGR